ncbi:MAG TPA: hypothetical protein VEM13_08655 [Gemmatimonadales bacterium]|nr:hypothetical protein [Gemmatimonadales bacterium]
MKRLVWFLMITAAATLGAQVPGDSGAVPPLPPADGSQAQQLRQQIRQRWNEHVRSTLGLDDGQSANLQATEQRFEQQRQPLRARQRDVNRQLQAELGSAAPDQHRVTELMNEQQENQLKLQQVNRAEDREMQSYLTPVQRARYQEERRQFQERVRGVLQRQQRRHEMLGPRGARRRP